MTAEQLEELLEHIEERKTHFGLDLMPISAATVASLAHRVIAAERLVKAASGALANYFEDSGEYISGMVELQKALTAYREITH